MPLIVPLPESVRTHRDSCTHPGLLLDKFVKSYASTEQETKKWQEAVQRPTAVDVVRLSQQPLPDFTALVQRRGNALKTLNAVSFRCTTTGPLTLHLARASALENAGICLHPLYGFAYLPGSGLKGMARAYAETVWLPAQTDQKQAWRQIEDVFGWAPHPDRRQQINDPNHPAEVRRKDDHDPESPEIKASSGNIVFHDAWPESWPQLVVDIVNNHHPDYYQAAPDDNDHPPGDWENPVPIYFLAVPSGTTFTFALAKRRDDVPDELLTLAQQWLLGALCHLGAGAKTAAGYGAFRPAERETPPLPTQRRATFETTLELVTPAFLAGANQQAEDCDLRPATLRGLLRWWWRTMHAGFVDVRTLRALEAAIWGDTKSGGAVRIELSVIAANRKEPYSHRRDRQSGTRYIAYGMDETSREQRKQRFRLDPPASWRLRLIARRARFFINRNDLDDPQKANSGQQLTADQVLGQAKAALWLLCTYGGAGSKTRKGFGSLATTGIDLNDLAACQLVARDLRQRCRIDAELAVSRIESPSISDPDLQRLEMPGQAASPDDILERIGRAYSAVAARFKHNVDQQGTVQLPNKAAWGLPRKIHGPSNDPLPHQSAATHQRPEWLDFPKRPRNVQPQNARHASPLHIHVAKSATGDFTVRLLAMPALYLPNRAKNVEMLKAFGNAFEQEFLALAEQGDRSRGSQTARPVAAARPSSVAAGPTPVRVKFLGPHDKLKDAFWVQEEGRRRGLLKYGTRPKDLPAVDSDIDVYRTNDNPNAPEYRWDPPPPTNPPRGGPGGKRPRGRR